MAKDPYKYFRIEARELLDGLVQGVLELEKGAATPELYARLLRFAHTLKGAARVVKVPAIAELAHNVEDVLSTQRTIGQPLGSENANTLLSALDEAAALLRDLDAAPVKRVVVDDEPLATLRVDIQKMDALVRSVTDTSAHLVAMRYDVIGAETVRDIGRRLSVEVLPGRE